MMLQPSKSTFQIDTKTVAPLMQIEPTSSSDKDRTTKASMVRTKKRTVLVDGQFFEIPYFSANGERGILRRNLTSNIFSKIEEADGGKMGIKELQLYGSGGTESVDGIKGLNYAEQARLRAINPFISLFGAGLSDMDGKLAICDLTPNIQMSAEEMKKMRFIGMTYGVRFDDTGRQSVLSPLISVDEIAAYMKKLEEKRKNDKALYKLEDEVKKLQELDNEDKLSEKQKEELFEKEVKLEEDRKKKGLSYQQVFKAEHINPGIELFSSIAPRAGHTFTELEKSMLLCGLFTLSQQSIGSWGRVGYGRLAWHIKNEDGQTLFKSTPDPRYTFTCHVEWTKEGEEMRRPFDQWLENIKREDLVF